LLDMNTALWTLQGLLTPRCSPSRLPSPRPGSGPAPSDHHHDIGS
jgi:hypothetical protein